MNTCRACLLCLRGQTTIKDAVIGTFTLRVPASIVVYFGVTHFGSSFTKPVPPLTTVFLHMYAFWVFMDFSFYWVHRWLHHPRIYKYIHKQHHEYKGPIGFASEYANPIEQVVSNFTSTVLVVIVTGTHPLVWLSWMVFRYDDAGADPGATVASRVLCLAWGGAAGCPFASAHVASEAVAAVVTDVATAWLRLCTESVFVCAVSCCRCPGC